MTDIRERLLHLGYHDTSAQAILDELDTLFKEIGFDSIKQATDTALEAKDTIGLISSLRDMMVLLEHKGYYRPDAPTRLIRLLVNGLNPGNEDIFAVLDRARIPREEKSKEQEFLASCAAITQLGYILLSSLVPEVRAASSGPHVFIIIDSFSHNSVILVDFSIGSIREIGILHYHRTENYYKLKDLSGLDEETSGLLTEYYSFFRVTSDIGLSHNIHNNLGIAYDKMGRYGEAIEELKEALRLDPGYIEVHNNLAVTYSRMGMFDEAILELEEAIRLRPEYTEAHSNLGNIYAGLGRYDEAIQELEAAIRLNPGYAGAHNNLGDIYALQKRNEEAIEEFNEAIRLDPDYSPARNNLGSIYAEVGRYEDALREFQEAIRLNPEFPLAYHGLGLAYYSLGSYERASHALINAVYLDPELLEYVPDRLGLKVRQGALRLKGRE